MGSRVEEAGSKMNTPGVSASEFKNRVRRTGLWVKTVNGWYASTAAPRTLDDFLNVSGVSIFDRDGHEVYMDTNRVSGAQSIRHYCIYRNLHWEIRTLYKKDSDQQVYEPVDLDNADVEAYLLHDNPKPEPYEYYVKIAKKLHKASAYHPREYNGVRLDARVPVADLARYTRNIEWAYADQD